MKNKYKNFMMNNRARVKTYINEIKRINNLFMPEDGEIKRYQYFCTELHALRHLFNAKMNTNITYKQFIELFNRA